MRGRILLVRHGVTEWNREGRFQGQLDPPLSADGLEEARLVGERIAASAEDRPLRIVSSPLSRALQTAQVIRAALAETDLEIEPDPRLMEVGQGEWEGRTHADLRVTDAARYAEWRTTDAPPPGGEGVEDAQLRIAAALEDAIAESERSHAWPVCLVSHGGAMRLAARHLLELTVERAWAMELDNASVSVVDWVGDRWRLVTWNDATHLLGRVSVHVDEEDGEPLAL